MSKRFTYYSDSVVKFRDRQIAVPFRSQRRVTQQATSAIRRIILLLWIQTPYVAIHEEIRQQISRM